MELRDTDLPLIKHVALYRMTYSAAVQRQFYPASEHGGHINANKKASEASTALARGNYLKDRHEGQRLELPGKHKYYILGEEGRKLLGDVSDWATKPPGPQALAQELAVNWFCNMKANPAYRLSADELLSAFPSCTSFPQNVVHCVRKEDFRVVYRVYIASAKSPKRAAEQLIAHVRSAWETECLKPAVASGEYGFAVLVPTPQAGKSVREALSVRMEKLKLPGLSPIEPRYVVELAPTPETFGFAIGEFKRSVLKLEENGNGRT